MAGMFIIHPRSAYAPVVDHDFALMIQEWAILPLSTVPNVTSMEFNWFTLNGRSAPYVTPLLVKLGSRVRIRFVNMSPIDHHPMHLHGHTFWVTGTEAGRIPESAWVPGNNVLVGVAQARDVEAVVARIGELAGPAEPPSRIHGDCWSGNVLWSGGRGWLIDPAAHGGHRETDLAMLALFGAPYLDRILGAYADQAPLAPGWRQRVPLHQLHPLLVHVVLFGAAYREEVLAAARAVLAI